jgi:hypothetical protein
MVMASWPPVMCLVYSPWSMDISTTISWLHTYHTIT